MSRTVERAAMNASGEFAKSLRIDIACPGIRPALPRISLFLLK